MELAKTSLIQVITLFAMIFLGFLLTKLKLIDPKAKSTLTNILVYLVVPCMIIKSYMTAFDSTILNNLLWCFLFSFLGLFIGGAIVLLCSFFWKTKEKNILRFAMTFSNAAYMGFPLIQELFTGEVNDTAMIYASGFLTVFNIVFWTYGYALVSRSFNPKKVIIVSILKTPVIYALIIGLLIFFFNVDVPTYVSKPIGLIGDMNTPLSMFIIGILVAQLKPKEIVKNPYMWSTIFIKLIVIPFITLGILCLFKTFMNIDTLLCQVIFILSACPCVSMTCVFAITFKYDEQVAVGSVVISTFLSLITLPLLTMLSTVVF